MSEYSEIQAQIAELQRKAANIRASERAAAILNIRALMATFEISASELSGRTSVASGAKKSAGTKAGQKVAAKYRDGAGNVWTGRGLKPRWLRAAIEGGATLESFLIS